VSGRTYAVIAGGGTAGHVLPGVAIAQALVAAGTDPTSILYVGSERGVERELVPAAGLELVVLPGRGIQRRLTTANIGAVWGLVRAVVMAWRLVGRRKPAVVVSLGGYASVPCSLAAVLRRIPVVVAEQNAVPGLANRLAGRWAAVSAVSFPGTDLPRAEVTGNPVRPEILAVDPVRDREAARARLGVAPDVALVVVFGGSLGARRINEAVLGALPAWTGRTDLVIRHVIGDRDHDAVVARAPVDDPSGPRYVPVRYEHDMPTLYAAADLVVCRAGATTVAELTAIGVPAVLVPLPGAPGDHQTANARALADVGGAVLVPDAELDGLRLRTVVDALLADAPSLRTMAAAARSLGRRDAADRVAGLVVAHARPWVQAPSPAAPEGR
jgi:UDP-N-acetylglucosamine--N-acetylmuramyl-(pentapeptide) pyrophosphoryl-undecaprenol N-acetylglucosamine transferase